VIALTAAALLSACAETTPPPVKTAGTERRHVSPPSVPAPVLPDGSFDHVRANAALTAAMAARTAGQLPDAKLQTEAAIDAWPANAAAWRFLADICQNTGDESCRRYAAFFQAKVEFANALPARAAVLGFQNIAEEPEGANVNGVSYDRKSLDAARHLWAFYNVLDTRKDGREAPTEPSWTEKYPYGSAALAAGVIAGALTLAKTVASK
jgi:hypothetical protein